MPITGHKSPTPAIERFRNYVYRNQCIPVVAGFGKWEVEAPRDKLAKFAAKAVSLGLTVNCNASRLIVSLV